MKQIFALLILLFIGSSSAIALEENEISSFMQTNIDQATTLLRNKKIEKKERAEKLFTIFDSIFDYRLMAQLAIGNKQWSILSTSKQDEYTNLFELKMKISYIDKLDLYTNEKLIITKLEKIKDTRIHLTTHLMKNNEVYEIIYKFYKDKKDKKDNWMIYDVDILGVSIIQTYRTQFADILAKESFEKLLERLQKEI